jgi:RNA polymerase sigma-70 factor (ECF subfamily)
VSITRVTDGDLVARARDGDHAAFGELVDRHRSAVYRAAMAALGSHADAEDVAQDAFVLAWRRLGSFRGTASFKTWLLTIAWHQAINRRRRLVRWWQRAAPLAEDEGTANLGPTIEGTPERLAADGQLRRAIRLAIRLLSPKLRDALLLAQSGDHTYEEIGAMLNAPSGTIKWRVSEGRRIVRQYLDTHGYGRVG